MRCIQWELQSLNWTDDLDTIGSKRNTDYLPYESITLWKINQQNLDECNTMATTTDYPEIMVIEGNQENLYELPEMRDHPESIDLDLELQISEYLHYEME